MLLYVILRRDMRIWLASAFDPGECAISGLQLYSGHEMDIRKHSLLVVGLWAGDCEGVEEGWQIDQLLLAKSSADLGDCLKFFRFFIVDGQ